MILRDGKEFPKRFNVDLDIVEVGIIQNERLNSLVDFWKRNKNNFAYSKNDLENFIALINSQILYGDELIFATDSSTEYISGINEFLEDEGIEYWLTPNPLLETFYWGILSREKIQDE
jgi:hypothetical protein